MFKALSDGVSNCSDRLPRLPPPHRLSPRCRACDVSPSATGNGVALRNRWRFRRVASPKWQVGRSATRDQHKWIVSVPRPRPHPHFRPWVRRVGHRSRLDGWVSRSTRGLGTDAGGWTPVGRPPPTAAVSLGVGAGPREATRSRVASPEHTAGHPKLERSSRTQLPPDQFSMLISGPSRV